MKYPILKDVSISKLISDSSLQHRVVTKGNEYSEDYLHGLAENIRLNGLKKPIRVVELEKEDFNPITGVLFNVGDLIIVDGFHRKEAIARLGYEKSEVEILKKGTFADAAALSCSANADNEYSRRRGTGDIKQAIKDYIDFLKADSDRTGKKLFVFRYAKWAQLFKCTEQTLHHYDFVKEFRDEVKKVNVNGLLIRRRQAKAPLRSLKRVLVSHMAAKL
ncbi:ParB N-terminal domain-containing protein [Vibrio sp. SCSIO 43136]|uniref:ParB N-terminal domain-containing protein n=1 Tax=Vibrio sp. SCSIO 43136 TaxID=2819101 RepID=UPI00207616E3|nr:ParB N-terminal domain-containing protein [Vibrio sp. SCSIO 43136]USD67367.1 ParB N-terminal domain-containing protein [Vibrio sp. SCSIO 43136]